MSYIGALMKAIRFFPKTLKSNNRIVADGEDGGVLGHLSWLKSILMRKD